MAAHSFLAKGEKVADDVIETARSTDVYSDSKLEDLRNFTWKLVENRGWTSTEDLEVLFTAGFTKQNVFEILVAISHKVLSNYTNHIVNTPIDDVFKKYTWQKPETVAA